MEQIEPRWLDRERARRAADAWTVPLDRAALRPNRGRLGSLAERLEDAARQVSAAGVPDVRRPITDGGASPLSIHAAPGSRTAAGARLASILERLEVRR